MTFSLSNPPTKLVAFLGPMRFKVTQPLWGHFALIQEMVLEIVSRFGSSTPLVGLTPTPLNHLKSHLMMDSAACTPITKARQVLAPVLVNNRAMPYQSV